LSCLDFAIVVCIVPLTSTVGMHAILLLYVGAKKHKEHKEHKDKKKDKSRLPFSSYLCAQPLFVPSFLFYDVTRTSFFVSFAPPPSSSNGSKRSSSSSSKDKER
jgi:hypothetical protein